MNHINPRIIRQVFILMMILLVGILIFREMVPYLSGVLGAITFHVLMRRIMKYLVHKRKWNSHVAAIVLMIGSFILILLPLAGIVYMLGTKISRAVKNSGQIVSIIKEQLIRLESYTGINIHSQINPQDITSWVSENLQMMAGGTFNAFIAIGLMYFMLYYMLINRKKLRESLRDYLPMNSDNINEIGGEIQAMVRSNAIGIPFVALAQGIIALIGFLIFGVEDPFFWFVITTIGSMIPFVGTLIGILPVVILALSAGDTFAAIGVALYGFIVVGSTDNIIRLYVLKRLDDVHPLITLIGVIVGVPLFGFIGLIFGPLMVSLFLALGLIYKQEYSRPHYHPHHHPEHE